jgi:hypothetical protein
MILDLLRRTIGRIITRKSCLGDFAWMVPPSNLVDPAPWDDYWRRQFAHGVAGFGDVFCNDVALVEVMRSCGLRTILCVGNGVSQEARALAWAGFDVTALDLSPLATAAAMQAARRPERLADLVGEQSQQSSGQLQFVIGDLCDVSVCPGPFDVVIERRTLQLYPEHERPHALQAVAGRLALRGIFFSHSHDGGWRPPAPRTHACEDWFAREGWPRWEPGAPIPGRVAWLLVTTG